MRERINWTWKRIVGTILGVFGIGTLTSCYGVYEDEFDIYGNVKGKVDGTEKTIEGIEVSLYKRSDSSKINDTKTDKDGYYNFLALEDASYKLVFKDVDGEKNGSFKQKEVDIEYGGNFSVTLENAE